VFDCWGVAFSEEASLKPLIARVLNSISFGSHWPKSFRDLLASSVVVINAVGVVDQPIEDAIGQSGIVTPDKSLIVGSGYLRNLVPGVVLLSGQRAPMLQVSVSYCFPKLRRRPVESN
jgi:hypothetical protein